MLMETSLSSFGHDNRADINTIFNSWEGVIITTITASVSTAASIVVLSLILQSEKGLEGSVYHRIIFGMCAADILQYVPIALTTLPMPTDMIYINGYKGLIIMGNNTSCDIQGFFIYLGTLISMLYNTSLSLYYLCSIRYDMSDDDFEIHIEPFLHFVSIIPSLILAGATSREIHPDPTGATWCQNSYYPWWCEGKECIGAADVGWLTPIDYAAGIVTLVCPMVIVICMVLIVMKVRSYEHRIDARENNDTCLVVQSHLVKNTQVITKQALAYSCVSICNVFTVAIFPVVFYFKDVREGILQIAPWVHVVFLLLRSAQGLLNSIIFVGHKAHSLRREFKNLPFVSAMTWALEGGEGDDQVISDLKFFTLEESTPHAAFDGSNGEVGQENGNTEGDHIANIATRVQGNNAVVNNAGADETSGLITTTPDPSVGGSSHDLSGFSRSGMVTIRGFGTFQSYEGGSP